MKTRAFAGLVVVVACWCLALSPGAVATTPRVKIVHLKAPLEALALSGNRVAYDVQTIPSTATTRVIPNRVYVWNTRTGAMTKVSGRQTGGADDTASGGVVGLAIAGTHVAWHTVDGSNSEVDEDLYSSSVLAPRERHVRGVVRFGNACGAAAAGPAPACAGTWLGGVVASGSEILANRWTTDTSGAITGGGLYTLRGTKLTLLAGGGNAVEAVAADRHRVAVVQWRWSSPPGTINVLSAKGTLLTTVTPTTPPKAVALSGRNLLVLEAHGTLALYDAQTGVLRKTFTLRRSRQGGAIAVYGNVAVYSTTAFRPTNSVRALNLATGKDSLVGRLPGQIPFVRMGSFGLAYANYDYGLHGYDTRLVFRPLAQVAAAVR